MTSVLGNVQELGVNGRKRKICLDSSWIYFMQQTDSDLFKIGFSNDPQIRRTALQVGNPHKLVLQFTHRTQRPDDLEDQIHADLNSSLVRGEWYSLPGTIDYQSIIRDAENKLNIRNEEMLQKEIGVQRLKLRQQLHELESQERMSKERERFAKGVDYHDSILPIIPFEDTIDEQISIDVDQVKILYSVFDCVSIDPTNFTMSMNEALFHAFLAEPNANKDQAMNLTRTAMKSICARRCRQIRDGELADQNREKNEGSFMDYHSLCIELLRQKHLTVVPRAIVRMSAIILATSPTFVLALNHQIQKITKGRPNMILMRCVWGIGDTLELETYLSQVQKYNLHAIMCPVIVHVEGKKKSGQCGRRVNFGKAHCSYHLD